MNTQFALTATGTDAGAKVTVAPQLGKTPVLTAYRATSDNANAVLNIYAWNGQKTTVTSGDTYGTDCQPTLADASIVSDSTMVVCVTPTGQVISGIPSATDATTMTIDSSVDLVVGTEVYSCGTAAKAKFTVGAATVAANCGGGPGIMGGKKNGPLVGHLTVSDSACSITTFTGAYID